MLDRPLIVRDASRIQAMRLHAEPLPRHPENNCHSERLGRAERSYQTGRSNTQLRLRSGDLAVATHRSRRLESELEDRTISSRRDISEMSLKPSKPLTLVASREPHLAGSIQEIEFGARTNTGSPTRSDSTQYVSIQLVPIMRRPGRGLTFPPFDSQVCHKSRLMSEFH